MSRNADPRYRKLRKENLFHYFSFKNMTNRDRRFGNLGGWSFTYESLKKFIDVIGPVPSDMTKPTVGRIKHDQGYVIGNFRWQGEFENKGDGSRESNRIQMEKGTHTFQKFTREDFQESGRSSTRSQLAKGIHVSQTGNTAIHNGRAGKASSQVARTCPHCGESGRGNGMFRRHFDRCEWKVKKE